MNRENFTQSLANEAFNEVLEKSLAADDHNAAHSHPFDVRALGIDTLLVRGHTDTVGTREYNMALSKRRADAVARVLAEGSYPVEGIDAKGLGSAAPIAENSSAEGRAKNRRVVIIVQVKPSSGALGGPTNEFVAVPARRYVWFA